MKQRCAAALWPDGGTTMTMRGGHSLRSPPASPFARSLLSAACSRSCGRRTRSAQYSSSTGGPADLTKGGTAMLVMRNFGYLGLHSVIHSKSSLAQDRLVDFTREVQVRRRTKTKDRVRSEEGDKREVTEEEERALELEWSGDGR